MIKYQNEDKTLIVPSGLGNIPSKGGSDVTKQDVIEIVNSAITEYDTGAQADLGVIRDNVSGNTADIAALSGQVNNLSSSTVTGLETAQNAANSANILASSAYTRANEAYNLAESLTGGTGGPNVYVLNLMTQEERANLYAELAPYRWQEQYMAVSSGFPVQDYAFYYFAGEETSEGWQDGDRGFVPMQLTAIHPDDYGGALFFTGMAKSRQNNNEILWVRYNITSTGEVDKNVERFMGGSGGSNGNYLIVNSLSDISNPYEGLEAYVKERTEYVEYTGYTIDASQISEGYVAHIYYDGANEKPVYRSGEAFHWEWDNNITDKFIDKKDFYYKINSAHTVFTVLLVNPAAYVTFEAGVTTATTSGTIDIFHKAVTYRYNGTEWEEYQPPKVYYLNEMTQAERADLYNEIFRYTETTFPAGNYRFFVTNEGNDEYQGRFEVFVARFYQGDNISFSGLMQSRYNKVLLQRGYKLTSEGNFNSEFSENTEIRGVSREIEINITSGGTIIGDDFNDLYQFLLYHTNNREAVLAPFPVLFRTAIPDSGETCYAGTVETYTVWHSTTQNSHNYIIFTSKVEWNGRTRVGKWKLWYDEQGWHTQTLYWGWLMNGLVCVYDNEYVNWSQTEKEEWYDRIIEECWNYDNTSFGLIRVSDKTSSADTGYNQMRVSYSIYRLESIEAGYNSLHFSGSEKDGDGPAERIYSARIARGGSIEYWEKRVDLSKLDNIYDSFIVAQYDNDNKSLTGITHSTKATIWESYKAERNEGFARKTIVAYVHTGDVVPARFNLISVDGNMEVNESGVKLYFGAVYNSIADSSLHSVRFSLSKNVGTDVYTIGDIVEYSYTAS